MCCFSATREEGRRNKSVASGRNPIYNWEEIREAFISGGDDVTAQSLSDIFGPVRTTIAKKISGEKWREQRDQFREEVEKKALKKIASKQSEIRARHMSIVARALPPVIEKLTGADAQDLTIEEARRLLKDLCDIERRASGIPEEHTFSMTRQEVENLTREERDRIIAGERLD